MENIFGKIKRHISQFFETEYWYRFRKISFFWFDDETNKYVERKESARDLTTITWDGENDILGMMLLKIDHMYYNLKRWSAQAYFYLDSFRILDSGTADDKLWAFRELMKEYAWDKSAKDKDWENRMVNYALENGVHENRFLYGYDGDHQLYYVRRWNKDGKISYFYGPDGNLTPLGEGLEESGELSKSVVEGVIKHAYSVHVPVTEYRFLSDGLKKHVRGSRRVLTDLLALRHTVKKLYLLEDTNDKYFNMWSKIEDPDERQKKLLEARRLYEKDRKDLYRKMADFMAENGEGWWD